MGNNIKKALNLYTLREEDITDEDIKVLNAMKEQFEEDAQLLIAEREIVRSILNNYLRDDGEKGVCTD